MKSGPRKPLTPDQVRQQLRQQGKTLTQWSEEHGFARKAVYRVMSGADKAWYGRAHEIAIALGLKVPDAQPTSPSAGGNTQLDAAA